MSAILCASQNAEDILFFKDIANQLKLSFKEIESLDELCKSIISEPNSCIIIDTSNEEKYRLFDKEISEKVGYFNQSLNPNLLFFVSDLDLYESLYHTECEIFGNFLPRNFSQKDSAIITKIISAAFGNSNQNMNKIGRFLNNDTSIENFKINNSSEKNLLVDSVRDHLLAHGFKIRSAAKISVALDELIMNAIFDAPVDESGKYIYISTPRSTEIIIPENKTIEFSIGFDGTTLCINVLDHYGSLDKKKMLRHIAKSYRNEEYKVKSTVAGAGIGLANVYRNCGGLIFECDVNSMTSVTLLYHKTNSFKEFKNQFRFLSTHQYFSI